MTVPVVGHVHPEWEDFGALEWTLVAVASLFVVWTIYKTVKYALAPGEDEPDHIKRMIFEPSDGPQQGVSSPKPEDADPAC